MFKILNIKFLFFLVCSGFFPGQALAQSDPVKNYMVRPSPDGQAIAFYSNRDGHWQIYMVGNDGGGLTRVVVSDANDQGPAWSPGGTSLVFFSDRDGDYEIYTVDTDGYNLRQLTFNSSNDRHPVWSPDGKTIAFFREEKGQFQVFVMDSKGSEPRLLKSFAGDTSRINWSPDSRSLVFYTQSAAQPGGQDLVILDVKDGGANVLAPFLPSEGNPSFSPDGTALIFDANATADGYFPSWEIWQRDLESGTIRQLTHNENANWGAAYFADGQTIVFIGEDAKSGAFDIYTMNAEGGELKKVEVE